MSIKPNSKNSRKIQKKFGSIDDQFDLEHFLKFYNKFFSTTNTSTTFHPARVTRPNFLRCQTFYNMLR